jgi:proteasome lid subunit RPN8/RPN11
MPPVISFTAESWQSLKQLSEHAYPNEGCGLLLGPLGKEKEVQKIVTLRNVLLDEGRGRFDFSFSPQEFMEAQRAAENQKLDVVGIFHTHPDHPPRPSTTDERQPMLAGWINIIASVVGGKFKEAKAWYREDDQRPFEETTLILPPWPFPPA